MKGLVLIAAAMLFCARLPAQSWRLQYFYDKDDSSLDIVDLKFPSPERGIAIGYIRQGKKAKPTGLVTSDGGRKWDLVPLKEAGFSLFFLNERLGWMVAKDSIWRTEDSGLSWKKLKSLRGIADVYFMDEKHGWAVGAKKSVYETSDGGVQWSEMPAAKAPNSNPEYTTYAWIRFANPRDGMIGGWSSPPRRQEQSLPAWMDPAKARRQREWPQLFMLLETRDSGKTWRPETVSMFGRVIQVSLSPDGRGLGLIEFLHSFEYPSEVFSIDQKTGNTARVFRSKDRLITDVAIVPNGPAYLAGIEPSGTLGLQSPIPGKVKILQSQDLDTWKEMEVDYRAVAHRVVLAKAVNDDLWAATDTGMILKLQETRNRKQEPGAE